MHFHMGTFLRLITFVAAFPLFCYAAKELAEIIQLRAEPDFRAVKLNWEYPKHGSNFYGFQVHYCELQAWGPNRCRNKIVDESTVTESLVGKKFRTYSVIISSLRMATNYSFEVRPLHSRHNTQHAKDHGKTLIVPTKGFSAKANLCLPDVSEVEVSTGPYFGGRITVESSNGAKTDDCSVGGDATSARDTYILRIEHNACGSTVNRTTVSTFILVQETLPILTHSTRRFLVLCTFQPETLTVRAGINMPHTATAGGGPSTAIPYKSDISLSNEILGNDVQAASLMHDNVNYGRSFRGDSESHYVLVGTLILTSIVGIGLTIWWMVPLKRSMSLHSKRSNISMFSADAGVSTVYENYTNSIIDNVSITEIDFGDIINDSYFDDKFKNEVFNPTMTEYCPEGDRVNSQVFSMPSTSQSHSEA